MKTDEDLKPFLGKRVRITTASGARYGGTLHRHGRDFYVLAGLVIIHRNGSETKSGSSESRTFRCAGISDVAVAEDGTQHQ